MFFNCWYSLFVSDDTSLNLIVKLYVFVIPRIILNNIAISLGLLTNGVPDKKISIYSLPLAFNKILKASHGGNSIPDKDIPRYIKLIENKKINFNNLITHEFKLSEINDAINLFKSGKAGRIIIKI